MASARPHSTGHEPKDGLFLSLLSVAHNAGSHLMESISKDGKIVLEFDTPRNMSGLDSKLDSLLQGGTEVSNVSSTSGYSSPGGLARFGSGPLDHLNPLGQQLDPVNMESQASNVHFEPIRDSPVSTMGMGNLMLLHFDLKKLPKRAVPDDNASKLSVNGGVVPNGSEAASNRLSVSGDNEGKVVRRKSILNGSVSEEKIPAKDEPDVASAADVTSSGESLESSTNQELDQILDSATVRKASKKKNREFHHAFRKIPNGEPLIADFSCALSKDILVQGKMYLSQYHICFNSNILGWVTNISIPLREVIQIEKKSTAVLFPNGMIIRTLHQKFVFATFLSRDATFNLITKVWHDALQEKVADDPSRKRAGTVRSRFKSPGEDVLSPAPSDFSDGDFALDPIATSSNASIDERVEKEFSRRLSIKKTKTNKSENPDLDSLDDLVISEAESDSNRKGEDTSPSPTEKDGEKFNGFRNPGPKSHSPTNHDYSKSDGDIEIAEISLKAPLGVVFDLLFGADSSYYIKILENQKNFDILTGKITGLSKNKKERSYSYIKPLGGAIGPKQTKCLITDTLKTCDFSKFVEVEQVTQTPDVPSGNSFKVKTRLFFTWGPENTTKVLVITSIEWSAKSWIKGAIEKGSIDGQKDSIRVLSETLTDLISAGGSSGSKKKRRKTKSVSSPPLLQKEAEKEPPKPLTLGEQITGLLETVGNAVPIQIPMVGASVTGLLVLIVFSFIYSLALVKLIGGGRGNDMYIQGAGDSDTFSRLVKVNDQKFFILPTSDTYLSSKRNRKLNEAKMWNWINERSQGKLKASQIFQLQDSDYDAFLGQEFDEVVRLAKQRIDQLYNQLDSD